MNDTSNNSPGGGVPGDRNHRPRLAIAAIIAALAVGYTAAVLAGAVAPNHQLSGTNLILLGLVGGVIAVIIRPDVISKVSSFSAAGIQVTLKEVQDKQEKLAREQEIQLELLREIFPLLLPDNVLKHLKNLEAHDQGQNIREYSGYESLRQELRQLLYMNLISVVPPHKLIGEVPEGPFALPEYVQLTPQGIHWLDRAHELVNLARK